MISYLIMEKGTLFIIMLLLLSIQGYCQVLPGKWVTKVKELERVECVNQDLQNLADSLIRDEVECNYKPDSLMLAVSVKRLKDDFIFELDLQISKEILLEIDPLASFECNGYICFIYFEVPPAFFSSTKEIHRFNYKEYIPPKKLKKDEYPLLTFNDESFSSWSYLYTDYRFMILSEDRPCMGKGYIQYKIDDSILKKYFE